MKTKEVKNADVQGTNAGKKATVKTNIRPNITGKEAKNAANEDNAPAQTPQVEETNAPEVKTDSSVAVDNQPADTTATPKAEEVKPAGEEKPQPELSKKELKEGLIRNHLRSLDQTVNLVLNLSRKIKQRDMYKIYLDTLSEFQINQIEEDENEGNRDFQSCELIIRDGKGREFINRNPKVIGGTVDFMGGRFLERLAEIEAEIVIPA